MEFLLLALAAGIYVRVHTFLGRRRARRDADTIALLEAELECAERALTVQHQVIYDLSCQIHGRAATDRAMLHARQRGTN